MARRALVGGAASYTAMALLLAMARGITAVGRLIYELCPLLAWLWRTVSPNVSAVVAAAATAPTGL